MCTVDNLKYYIPLTSVGESVFIVTGTLKSVCEKQTKLAKEKKAGKKRRFRKPCQKLE